MDRYTFKEDDALYRFIDLTEYFQEPPRFRPKEKDSLPLKENFVLEVQDKQGKCTLYACQQQVCRYIQDGNQFRLPLGIPVAWLWVREKDRKDKDGNLLNPYRLMYKAPTQWQVRDDMQYCAFVGTPADLELVGDERGYFAAAYDLSL